MRTKIVFTIADLPHKYYAYGAKTQSLKEKKLNRWKIAQQLPSSLLPIHASLVATAHKSILICGPSKSGKTTLSQALRPYGFKSIAKDFVVIWQNNDRLYAGDLNYQEANVGKNGVPIDRIIFLSPKDPRDVFKASVRYLAQVYAETMRPMPLKKALRLTRTKLFQKIKDDHICLGNRISVERWVKSMFAIATPPKHRRIGILGLGNIGQDVANLVIGQEWCKELHLHTRNQQKLDSLILDLKSGSPGSFIKGHTSSAELIAASQILVFCFRTQTQTVQAGVEERIAKYLPHAQVLWEVSRQIRKLKFSGQILMVTNPSDLLAWWLYYASQIDDNGNMDWQGLLSNQVWGVGLGLDYNRLRVLTNKPLDLLGPHGDELVLVKPNVKANYLKLFKDPLLLSKLLDYSKQIRLGTERTRFGPAHETVSVIAALCHPQNQIVRVSTMTRFQAYLGGPAYMTKFGLVQALYSLNPKLRSWLLPAIEQQQYFQKSLAEHFSLPLSL